jgi:hypothetical protein
MLAPGLLAFAALLLFAPAAEASSCAEEAELLARQYGLAGAGSAPLPEERSTRPTLESPPSHEARRSAEGAGSAAPPLDPARRARMEASLASARAEDDERRCFELLEEARSAAPGASEGR